MANIWQSMGSWEGGTVLALALSPHFQQDHLALAATAAGLWRSTDGGQSWAHNGAGITDPNLVAVHFIAAPANAAALPIAFAASQGGRLFQSADGGQTWQEVSSWQGLGTINALASSPNFAQDQTLFAATAEGVMRTQDGGQSWESSTFGLLDLEILCLAVSPAFAESETLWAGSAGGGLYRSRNGARSWRDAGDGLPDTALLCLALDPDFVTNQTLYVGTEGHGIYRSTDGNATWQELSSDLAGLSINSLTLTSDGRTLLGGSSEGILRSTDRGQSWQPASDGQALVFALANGTDDIVLAGSFLDGLLRSIDGGAQWEAANQGLAAHAPPVTLLSSDGRLFALDREGVLAVTADGGAHWPPLNHLLADLAAIALAQPQQSHHSEVLVLTETALITIAPAPDEEAALERTQSEPLPATILQPTQLVLSPDYAQDQTLLVADAAGQIFCSMVDGHSGSAHWEQRTTPAPDQTILQLCFSPAYATTRRLYALTMTDAGPANYPMQLWLSQDQGDSWTALADFAIPSPAIGVAIQQHGDGETLWLVTHNRILKFYQQPADQQWAFEQFFLAEEVRITSVVAPQAAGSGATDQAWPIYVTTTQGIYASNDGQQWQNMAESLATETWVALHCDQAGAPRYAVALGGRLWRTGD